MRERTCNHLLIAGGGYVTREMLDYARRAVQRAYQIGWTILVGDNSKGVDMVVVQECRRLKATVIVAGIANFPRNYGCKHGSYIKVTRDLYRSAGGDLLDGCTARDRWMVDNCQRALFIWNGDSPGTKQGYGYAVHDGVCVYLNLAGPRMAVEAIRAKLSKGDQVSVVPPDAPAVELTSGEGNSGMYHPYRHYLPEARFASLILVHDWAVTPNYGGKFTTFIFRTSDAQATAKLRHHVMQLVNIPAFEQ